MGYDGFGNDVLTFFAVKTGTPSARFCRVFLVGFLLPLADGGDGVLGVAHGAGAGGWAPWGDAVDGHVLCCEDLDAPACLDMWFLFLC